MARARVAKMLETVRACVAEMLDTARQRREFIEGFESPVLKNFVKAFGNLGEILEFSRSKKTETGDIGERGFVHLRLKGIGLDQIFVELVRNANAWDLYVHREEADDAHFDKWGNENYTVVETVKVRVSDNDFENFFVKKAMNNSFLPVVDFLAANLPHMPLKSRTTGMDEENDISSLQYMVAGRMKIEKQVSYLFDFLSAAGYNVFSDDEDGVFSADKYFGEQRIILDGNVSTRKNSELDITVLNVPSPDSHPEYAGRRMYESFSIDKLYLLAGFIDEVETKYAPQLDNTQKLGMK